MAHIPRIYVPGHVAPGPLRLDAEQARRLSAVMRLREGDPLLVFPGDGREWHAIAGAASRAGMAVTVTGLARQEAAPAFIVEVWCSLVRSNRLDWAIEKCTEAGADLVRPLISEHAARGDSASPNRLERWERIAIEASEQCGRVFVPVIEPPQKFAALLERQRHALLIADREGRPWLQTVPLLPPQGRVTVAIGPEGGFSEAELALADRHGALRVRLGPHILRTETAAVAAVSLLRSG